MDFVYRASSLFLKSERPPGKTIQAGFQTGTLFDLDQKGNLGKTIEVEYKIENKINYIDRITLYNNP